MPDMQGPEGDPNLYLYGAGLMPKPPKAEGTVTDDIVQKRLDLSKKQEGLEDQELANLSQLRQREVQLSQQKTPVPADPRLSNIPKAPAQDFTDPIKAFQNPAVLIATLGSLFTRAPLTTALKAGAGAMEAYHKGEAENFAHKNEEWKNAVEEALKQNGVELERYNVAWKKSDASVKDKMAELQAIASGYKHEVLMEAIHSGRIERVDKILEEVQKAQDRLKEVHERSQILDPGVIENNAQLIANGGMPPVTGYGLRSKGGSETMARVYEINPNYRAEDYYASKAAKTAAVAAEPRAAAAALTAITKQKAAVDAYEGLARKNSEVLIDLAAKVDSTGIPVIERWLRAGMQATGDPDVARFNTQIQIYRNEVARILTNPNLTGVLTDHSRKESEGFLSGGISLRQLKGVVGLLNQDFDRRKGAIQAEIDALKGQLHGETPASSSGPTRVNSPAEAQRLAPGTHYITPDGQEFTR